MRQAWRRALTGALATLAAVPAMAGTATAGVLVTTTADCGEQPLSQPFARWLDPLRYTPLADGSFEAGADGWRLEDGARVVAGNEPWSVAGAGHARSLALPAGSSAVSPPICVGPEHPTVRLFAKRTSGPLSVLAVSAVIRPRTGGTLELPVGVVAAGGGWQPTLPMALVGNLLPVLPGQHTPVSLRFTPLLGGAWQIDDVYVDPFRAR